ncbi:2',5'-phosphodiesterase 12 [Osmia lignaria lignaria]|uniref:2',5'-phosphodiesterase 12 n=1 Tax=Osmia lignaria lignaria TaxID=1437193 RepID=UPI0014783A25|nr:2',5'-phosphodiesterase 12 [Osmia lignaria]
MSILFRNLHLKYLTSFLTSISTVYQGFCKRYSQIMVQLNINEALLIHEEGSTKFDMLLRYINPALNIDRRFNFHRSVDEPINNFLQRIDMNIKSYIIKKSKRKNKKAVNLEANVMDNIKENNIKFMLNDCVLNGSLTCQTILENSSEIKLIIFGEEYIVKHNVPFVTKMELPLSILIDFPIYPSKFETMNVNKSLSTFNWYKHENNQWVHVGEGFLYTPNKSDLGCKLKVTCIPRNTTQIGPTIEIVSSDIVQPGPGLCPFDTRHAFTKNKLSGKSFRLTSYNILANVYSETSLSKDTLYPYCPQYALSMDYRKLLILKELIGYNTDIICLQEVDSKVYENDLMLSLNALNYDGVFNLKNDLREGLVIFYNRERFDKLNSDYSVISQGTELDEFKDVWLQIENENVKQAFLNRNTIIQTVILKSKENPEILVIGNTHLYFRPEADHIRLLQAYYGLTYLHSFAGKVKKENPECNVSIIYCGDFNSVPDSAVYRLMTQKHILNYYNDWHADSDQRINLSIKHDVNLSSACGTPKYTNYTGTFSGCLDYIFYQMDHLEVEQVIPLPSEEELSLYTGLPSVVFPSDHISLCVDLKWSK